MENSWTLVLPPNKLETVDEAAEKGLSVSKKMVNGETETKPKSLLWKRPTDSTRFDWRIWICKSRTARLVIWNSCSARTTASPCSHIVSADERWLRSKRRRHQGETKENGASFTFGCFWSTSSFTRGCITLHSELLSSHVKVYFLLLLLFWHDDPSWQL